MKIEKAVSNGSNRARYEVINQINAMIKTNLTIAFFNICTICFACLFFWFFKFQWAKFIICSIYASSVIYSFFSFLKNFFMIKTIIFEYKLNIYRYIKDEVYNQSYKEAKDKIDNLGPIDSVCNFFFGESEHKIASDVTNETMSSIWIQVFLKLVFFAIVFFSYIFIFRLFVSPILIKSSTDLNTIEAFFYPFIYSIKYFFAFF